MRKLILCLLVLTHSAVLAQNTSISGMVMDEEKPIPFANVALVGTAFGAVTDDDGKFLIESISNGKYELQISSIGFRSYRKVIDAKGESIELGT